MLERLTDQVNAMLNAVFGKIVDPLTMRSVFDQSIKAAMIATRQQLAQAIATEAQLNVHLRKQPEHVDLQLKLAEVSKLRAELAQRLDDLEFELLKERTKGTMLPGEFGLHGPLEPIKLSKGAVLIFLSFSFLWLLGAVFMIVKHLT